MQTEPSRAIPYDLEALTAPAPQRTFTAEGLREIAFPLGGIGTGCISLGGRGQLRDWEVFNRPNQGYRPQFTFVTLRAQADACEPVTRVAESPVLPPYCGPFGLSWDNGEGLPHLASNTFRGEYPFARLDFEDPDMPLRLRLEAFNPFIPLEPDDSGLPVAVLTYRLANPGERGVGALLVFTIENVVGYAGTGPRKGEDLGRNRNVFRSEDGLRGLVMDSLKYPHDSARYGSIVLATPWPEVTYTGRLADRAGMDAGHHFWRAVHLVGGFDDRDLCEPTEDGKSAICALGMKVRLEPGETADVPVLLAWHFPNYVHRSGGENAEPAQWLNHYATRFESAWDVAAHVHGNLERLRGQTMRYHDALFGSTLPACVLDAASSQTSTLKSCTCLRLEEGTFYGFEGCGGTWGCCPGSCTHVWNYQQALPFLFPSLERSMRAADYTYNLREEDGKMCFRIGLPLGTSQWHFHACADGQLGGVMKTYRDWLLCGDDEWLRALWPRLKEALAYAWEAWDTDRDGLPDGVQHNTYDIEFHGPNPLIGCFYLGALRAAEEMARHLGEDEQADQYRAVFEKGSAAMDEQLWNGDYYVQRYDPAEAPRHQIGEGCLSDQMLGQWIAAVCGLGYLLEPERVRAALQCVFRSNWRADLRRHVNPMRIYALNDEAGLLMCSWPRGNRPLIPSLYADEVWTGIEYQVASHLIMEGFVPEGLAIVKGARDRHDGRRRNPWDEAECGSHYARAMSSWGLVLALSGYFHDASRGLIQFAPKLHAQDFRCFWSSGSAWGTFEQRLDDEGARVTLSVQHGAQRLELLRLELPGAPSEAAAELNGESPACSVSTEQGWTEVAFAEPVTIAAGRSLHAHLPG